MSGMDESLRPLKSRITIFDEPVICQFCSHDVFIPHEVYINVEQPGIGVYYVQYAAICHHCGEVKLFSDPSGYDVEKGDYIWALNQYLLSIRKYKAKILCYVGKRKKDKITAFINKLREDFEADVEVVKDFNGEVLLQLKFSDLNDIQINRMRIIDCAKRLHIYVKELIIK
jgi:hypothetical protein